MPERLEKGIFFCDSFYTVMECKDCPLHPIAKKYEAEYCLCDDNRMNQELIDTKNKKIEELKALVKFYQDQIDEIQYKEEEFIADQKQHEKYPYGGD